MDDNKFNSKALKILSYIAEEIESKDLEAITDIDFLSDIIRLSTPAGEFVINKHSAAKQIWLASPKSGPHHFTPQDNGEWLNKDNMDLFKILNEELSEFFEIDLKYEANLL